MDYEKKYKEALKEAEKIHKFSSDIAEIKRMEQIFPELKESEDEKIKNRILFSLQKDIMATKNSGCNTKELEECVAWIEKQGEQKPFDYENANIQQKDFAPKVEPKFKVGDWIVDNIGIAHQIEKTVLNVTNNTFGYDIVGGGYFNDDSDVHLWTTQDVKDGDVLASKDKEDILIYKSNSEIELLLTSHISFNKKLGFCPRQYSEWYSIEFTPATKEQRDLLFSKMKEAGYEWNAEKKELKRIEDGPENYKKQVMSEMTDLVKDYIGQKPSWSEGDERNLEGIIDEIEANKNSAPEYDLATYDRFLSWLKSLKERIRG